MFYRIKDDRLYDYADYEYDKECLETDIITQKELQEHPQKVIVGEKEIEIEVPDFEVHDIEVEIHDVDEEGNYIYDEEGNPVMHTETRPVQEQVGSHIETKTIKILILNPEWNEIELKEAKEKKIIENDSKRDVALNQGVIYKQVLFDSDTDQKINLLATVSMINEEDKIEWFGMDNVSLLCDKEDLINIGGLITQLHSFCWNKNAEIKNLINNATTIEEVDAIEIDYEMGE